MNYLVPLCIALILFTPRSAVSDNETTQTDNDSTQTDNATFQTANDTSTTIKDTLKSAYTVSQRKTEETGSLYINVNPEECNVVLNEVRLGKGDQMIESLPVGKYNLFVEYGGNIKSETILIESKKLITIDINMGKKKKYFFEPKYSFVLIDGLFGYGPQIGIGLNGKNNLIMLDINYNLEVEMKSNTKTFLLGCSLLKWSHCFSVAKNVALAPGLSAGIWLSIQSVWNEYDERTYYDRGIYYGGPHIKMLFLKGDLKLVGEYSVLIGSNVAHVFGIGGKIAF